MVADVFNNGDAPRRRTQGIANTPGDRCQGDRQESLPSGRPNSGGQACQSAQPCYGPIQSWRLGAPAPTRCRRHRNSSWHYGAGGQPGGRGHGRRRASPSGISRSRPPGVTGQHPLHSPPSAMARLWRVIGAIGPACRELSGPGLPCSLCTDPVQGRGRCDAMLISEVALDLYRIGGSEACPLMYSRALILASTSLGPGHRPPTLPHLRAGWLWVLSNSDSILWHGIFASCPWIFGAGKSEMLPCLLGTCLNDPIPAALKALDSLRWTPSPPAAIYLETPSSLRVPWV